MFPSLSDSVQVKEYIENELIPTEMQKIAEQKIKIIFFYTTSHNDLLFLIIREAIK